MLKHIFPVKLQNTHTHEQTLLNTKQSWACTYTMLSWQCASNFSKDIVHTCLLVSFAHGGFLFKCPRFHCALWLKIYYAEHILSKQTPELRSNIFCWMKITFKKANKAEKRRGHLLLLFFQQKTGRLEYLFSYFTQPSLHRPLVKI